VSVGNTLSPAATPATGCSHTHRARKYSFQRKTHFPLCAACAMRYAPVLRRAIIIALVVGTILTMINQGDILVSGAVTPLVVLKICLTYMVPYGVSTVSALAANHI
jgi:hypothetical protein